MTWVGFVGFHGMKGFDLLHSGPVAGGPKQKAPLVWHQEGESRSGRSEPSWRAGNGGYDDGNSYERKAGGANPGGSFVSVEVHEDKMREPAIGALSSRLEAKGKIGRELYWWDTRGCAAVACNRYVGAAQR